MSGGIKLFQLRSPKIPFGFPKIEKEGHSTGTHTGANYHLKRRSKSMRHTPKGSDFIGSNPREFEIAFSPCFLKESSFRRSQDSTPSSEIGCFEPGNLFSRIAFPVSI